MQRSLGLSLLVIIAITLIATSQGDSPAGETKPASPISAPTSMGAARARAQLLHEMIHGTLQVMHRDFFDEDDAHAIPSASLEDVFHEMSRSFQVNIKWLNVNTDVVNIDHQPENKFEKDAATRLAAGEEFVESSAADRYHFAGSIRLRSQCLKCHVKNRTSTKDRTAGLVISMPLPSVNSPSQNGPM